MCNNKELTDEEILALAKQDRPISREELGIKTPATPSGLQTLTEGFDFLQSFGKEKDTQKGNKE